MAADLAERVGWQVSAKWKTLAPYLGLEMNDIAAIQMQEQGSPEECMARVFDHWMRRGRREYTWYYLIEVLEKPAVGLKNVSEQLRKGLPPKP